MARTVAERSKPSSSHTHLQEPQSFIFSLHNRLSRVHTSRFERENITLVYSSSSSSSRHTQKLEVGHPLSMGLKRGRPTAIHALLLCLVLAGSAVASPEPQRLAVIVPAHAGDLRRAVSALDRWPKTCSPVTQESVDLVLYYAEGEDDAEPLAARDAITSTAGRCFAHTKLVYAKLSSEVRDETKILRLNTVV